MPPLHVIGLTGNIASGKSTAASVLHGLGADVIDADAVAHDVLAAETPETAAVAKRFGRSVIAENGAVDRIALGQIVFADSRALSDLEGIVHPGTRRRIFQELDECRARVAVIEAIKLLEGPLADRADSIWVITAPPETRLQRLTRDRALSAKNAAARIDAQNPESAKVSRADVVIVNDGTLRELKTKVEEAWGALQVQLAAAHTGASAP